MGSAPDSPAAMDPSGGSAEGGARARERRPTPAPLSAPALSACSVQLRYSLEPGPQQGAAIANPLFELLQAVSDHGSILKAAKAVDASYRHVWGAIKRWEELLGQPLLNWVQGQPARLTPFSERLLWAETRARARLTPHIEALRVELARVLDEAMAGQGQQVLTVFASHDLALPALRERARGHARVHMDLHFCGSVDALQALSEGRCQVAGFHVPVMVPGTQGVSVFAQAMKSRLSPGRHKLIGCMRRAQGLMVRKDVAPPRSLREVAEAGLRMVNRQPGSGTRLLMDHLFAESGLADDAIPGWLDAPEESHVAVAASVASGVGDVGPGIAAAARQFGLQFVPLVEEDYFLVCLKDALDEPAVQALQQVLASPEWAEDLAALEGYAPAAAPGEVLSLTRALPWWQFHHPKLDAAAGRPARQAQGALGD